MKFISTYLFYIYINIELEQNRLSFGSIKWLCTSGIEAFIS